MKPNLLLTTIIGLTLPACGIFDNDSDSDEHYDIKMELPLLEQEITNFHSCQEISDYIQEQEEKRTAETTKYYQWFTESTLPCNNCLAMSDQNRSEGGNEGSPDQVSQTTNIQVDGIDEADLVKISEHHLYVARPGYLEVLRRSDHKLLQSIEFLRETKIELIVHKNRLAAIGVQQIYGQHSHTTNIVKFFEVSPQGLNLIEAQQISGSIRSIRLLDNRLVIVAGGHISRGSYWLQPIPLDTIQQSHQIPAPSQETEITDHVLGVPCEKISRPIIKDFDFYLTHISSINLLDLTDKETQGFMNEASHVYSSHENIYLVKNGLSWLSWDNRNLAQRMFDSTFVRKVKYDKSSGKILSQKVAQVKGRVLTRYSLHELEATKDLAITTTSYYNRNDGSSNHLFVFADDPGSNRMVEIGAVKDIAPTETVRSVRYIKDYAYVVTYRKIDPLFAIDLSHPTSPTIRGELKVPGFSSYLHSLDENTLIGIGQSSTWGGGLQFSLFDISNPENLNLHTQKVFYSGDYVQSLLLNPHGFYLDRQRQRVGVSSNKGALILELENNDVSNVTELSHNDLASYKCPQYLATSQLRAPYPLCPVGIERLLDLDNQLISVSRYGVKVHNIEEPKETIQSIRFQLNPAD